MRAEMLMAKLTARGLLITGGAFGGRVELSWTDVAGGLGGLAKVPSELMRIMYLDDRRGEAVVLAALREFILQMAMRNQIKISKAVINGLASLALHEVTSPPHCTACNGTGEVQLRIGVVRVCGKCDGSCYGSRGIREQAELAGMKKDTFNNKYSWLAGRTYSECALWLRQGVLHLSTQLADAA